MGRNLATGLGHSKNLFVSELIKEPLKEANLKLKVKVEAAYVKYINYHLHYP